MVDRDQTHSSPRGFASMDEQKQREIASRGGQASGGNFRNDPERAVEAGRKGGQNVPAAERSFARDPLLAAEAGRKGGQHSHSGGGARRGTAEPQVKPGGTVGREIPEHSQAHDTEIAVEAGRHPGEHRSGAEAQHEPRHYGAKPGGTVGREIPERSKQHDTEIAVEAGRQGRGAASRNRRCS